MHAQESLNLANLRVEWDDNDKREVEESKKIYQQARREGRKIVDLEGNPISVFKPALLGFRVLQPELSESEFAMRILNELGDETVVWDSKDPKQVQEAAKLFFKYMEKGWKAFAISQDGTRKRRIRNFDPKTEEITFEEFDVKEKLKSFVKAFKRVELLPRTYPG